GCSVRSCCGCCSAVADLIFVLFVRLVFFFFFSSRRRHTRLVSDWSSDVCSSDLPSRLRRAAKECGSDRIACRRQSPLVGLRMTRSEERRVGKEWRSRWSPDH